MTKKLVKVGQNFVSKVQFSENTAHFSETVVEKKNWRIFKIKCIIKIYMIHSSKVSMYALEIGLNDQNVEDIIKKCQNRRQELKS